MCMTDGPFLLIDNEQETALDDVASLLVKQGKLCLIDVFGKQREIEGMLQEIDLLNRRIVLA
ncbi:MAG: hypothetical protein C0614_02940 [Desulfuromonas sp.]|nr:MAG: hypothetical protein C0614_02940 [Desulfuromonas sp.]